VRRREALPHTTWVLISLDTGGYSCHENVPPNNIE
jgi:hypothetical protein